MTKLAPILKEISKNVRVGGYDGSRSHDGKLHETFALSRRSGRGPKSIIWTPAMAKHNSRVIKESWLSWCSQPITIHYPMTTIPSNIISSHVRPHQLRTI